MEDLFDHIDDFREYVKIDASTKLEALKPAYRPAKRKVQQLIGKATYQLISDHYKADPRPEDAILDEALEYTQAAVANMMHIDYFMQMASERNATENKLFKYQEDQQLEINITNYWVELDNLLELLESDNTKFPDFPNTKAYKLREKLLFKSAGDFDEYYGIDESAYFFMRSTYIQLEIIKDVLSKRGVDISALPDNDDFKYNLKKYMAYETMARSCRRFEYAELPKSIRNDLSDEMRRRVYKSSQADFIKTTYYQELHNEGKEYLLWVEDYIKKQESGTYEEPEDVNSEDNKFYFST